MTLTFAQPMLLPAIPRAARMLAVGLSLLLTFPLYAAEGISAHLDASGRVVFVNEGSEPPNPRPASSPMKADSPRKVLVSTAPAASDAPNSSVRADTSVATESVPGQGTAAVSHDLDTLIEQAASRHQIDPDLVRAIIRVESNYDPYAVSPKGARGLMQLIPATAQRFGVSNAFDPRANLDGGIRYLKYLLGMYGGDLQLALAAYNAGENSVARSRGVPAYRETQNYIRKVAELYPIRTVTLGIPQEPQIVKFVDEFGVVHFSNTDFR